MATKAGVWIDHRQAIMVLITDAGQEIKKVASGIAAPDRTNSSYTPNDYTAEDRIERKVENQLKTFYDEVIAGLADADALLIFGPGEAKDELLKRIKNQKRNDVTLELETSDKMTDRQIAAKVAGHFTKHHLA